MPTADYRPLLTPPAQRGLDRLPAAATVAVVEFVLGDLLWSARRGPYRVVYSIDESTGLVAVLRIDHRADVYRRR